MRNRYDPNAFLVNIAAPNRRGPKPQAFIGYVCDEYEKKNDWKNIKQRQNWRFTRNKCLSVIKESTPISEIKVSDLKEERTNASGFLAPLIWFLNGGKQTSVKTKIKESPPELKPSTNGHAPIKLKIQAASLDLLGDLIVSGGKHLELRTQVSDAIATCPADEFRIIPATKELIEDKRERVSIIAAVMKSIQPKGWVMRWAASRNVFYVIRKDMIEKFKKGAK